eukprot:356133-Chlamydomonas_euryale.AAC.9
MHGCVCTTRPSSSKTPPPAIPPAAVAAKHWACRSGRQCFLKRAAASAYQFADSAAGRFRVTDVTHVDRT